MAIYESVGGLILHTMHIGGRRISSVHLPGGNLIYLTLAWHIAGRCRRRRRENQAEQPMGVPKIDRPVKRYLLCSLGYLLPETHSSGRWRMHFVAGFPSGTCSSSLSFLFSSFFFIFLMPLYLERKREMVVSRTYRTGEEVCARGIPWCIRIEMAIPSSSRFSAGLRPENMPSMCALFSSISLSLSLGASFSK